MPFYCKLNLTTRIHYTVSFLKHFFADFKTHHIRVKGHIHSLWNDNPLPKLSFIREVCYSYIRPSSRMGYIGPLLLVPAQQKLKIYEDIKTVTKRLEI